MTTYVGNMRLERQNTSGTETKPPATVRRRFMAPVVEHCGSDFCQDVVNICPALRKRYVNQFPSPHHLYCTVPGVIAIGRETSISLCATEHEQFAH